MVSIVNTIMTDSLFQIDSQSPLPINIQIKEQIKLLIGKNLLSPGTPLPSTNQLADQLSINRNTIQWVYSQLKDEGLLVMQKGRGTRIADEHMIEEFKRRNPQYPFVEKIMTESNKAGYRAEDVLLAGFAYIQLFGAAKKLTTYLFIECKVNSCYFYVDEIKRYTTAEIKTIDIDAPEQELLEAIQQADVIVTTLARVERVKSLEGATGKNLISVGDPNDISLLLKLLQS